MVYSREEIKGGGSVQVQMTIEDLRLIVKILELWTTNPDIKKEEIIHHLNVPEPRLYDLLHKVNVVISLLEGIEMGEMA